MMGDARLTTLSTELEDAGLLGGAAASILGFIAFGENTPGYLKTTPDGAVWTKSISNASKHTANLGIAELTLEGGSLNTTAAFAFDDEGLTFFNLLVEFAGANAATLLTLEVKTSHAYLAPAKKEGNVIVGYNPKADKKPLKLPLPVAGSLEISIERTENGPLSALTLHGTPAGISAFGSGIFRFDLGDDVLVIPKLDHVGLSIKDLFIDLSSSAATPVSGLFPEAYAPSWTGLGAKSIGVHFPINHDDNEWINAGIDGFLLGFDGKVSAKGKIAYSTTENDKLVHAVTGEIDIRNNEVIRGALELELDLEKATTAVGQAGDGSSGDGLGQKQKKLLDTARADKKTATDKPAFSFGGDLKCRAQLIRIPLAVDDDILGFDITLEAIQTPGNPAGIVFQGIAARALMWLGLGTGATALLVTGVDDEDGANFAGGLGLTFLLICDLGDFIIDSNSNFLPKLQSLEIRKLTYRYVSFPAEGNSAEKTLHQIEMDIVLGMTLDGSLAEIIAALGGRLIDTAQSFSKLFAKNASEIEIKGPLELAVSNLAFSFEKTDAGTELVAEVDERVRRVAGQKDLQFNPRKFPAINLKAGAGGGGGSKIPKPIMQVKFLKKDDNGDKRYGLSLQMKGLENPDFKLESPVVLGVVVYFSPEFGIDFEASLIVEPRLRFAIPYWVLADGAFELDKPIPGFDGVQNRISIDVGLINSKVSKGASISKDNLKKLNDISNYKYRFGGELAWGEAFKDDPVKQLEFLFVEAHYDGASPFITIGPVGIYGLAGLFGKNIAPGMPGNTRDAAAIATWIEGEGSSFDNVLNWPAVPSESSWHPAKDFEEDETLVVAGLKVRAGPVGSNNVDVEGLLMAGFNEFWIAAAGRVKVRVIDFEGTAIVVYDDPSKSFALRIRFEFKIESGGGKEILAISGPIEISTGNGVRVLVGHYRPERGGPLVARLFGDLFRVQFYAVYESAGQPDFGFVLPSTDDRPDLGEMSFSHGLMFQYGPKKIGPSALHIRVHAAAGYNFGLVDEPCLIVGEIFLAGSLHVKVLFVKVGFTLAAHLAGRLTEEQCDFRGEVGIKIGMPWPISDIKVSVPFDLTLGQGDAIPEPALQSSSFALSHTEPKAEEFPDAGVPIVPIDAVVGLRFNRPIVGIVEGSATATSLPDIDPIAQINPGQPVNQPFVELVDTNLEGKNYRIEYEHYLSDVRVTHRPAGGVTEVVVPSMFAAWEIPAAYSDTDGAPDSTEKAHRALYLNALLQPGLDYMPENLGQFVQGQIVNGVLPPCRKPRRDCMMATGAPDIAENSGSGLRTAWRFSPPYGAILVRETSLPPSSSPLQIINADRLSWTGSALRLPHEVNISVPPASRVSAEIELHTLASPFIGSVALTLDVLLAGQGVPIRLLMLFKHTRANACGLALETKVLPAAVTQIDFDAQIKTCSQHGEIVIAVEVTAAQPDIRLRRMTLRGPHLTPTGMDFSGEHESLHLGRWLKLASETRRRQKLMLNDLCYESIEDSNKAWGEIAQELGNNGGGDSTVDDFIDHLLLEPNRDYTISYRVQSVGRSFTDADSADTINNEQSFSVSSGANSALRTLHFRTEAEPGQDISRYVGFVYPSPHLAPVYAEQTVPLVSFRNNGLIKRIFRAHRGADVLRPKIRDLDGVELATTLTDSLSISSGAAGELMEDLVKDCLDGVQGFTRIEIDIFERKLRADTQYGLSVEDTSVTPASGDLPPFRSAFKTSLYKRFGDHVAAANTLLADPVQLPLIEPDPSQLIAPIFAEVAASSLAGHDTLVEAIYRRTLGHETGRLATEFGTEEGVAAQFVHQMPDGSLAVFGMALELGEPLLGKEGVDFSGVQLPLPQALQGKGICLHQVGAGALLSVSDQSGSRLLLFSTLDAATFSAWLSPVQLAVNFSGKANVRATVAQYVEKYFAVLSDPERENYIQAALTEIENLPQMAGGLSEESQALILNPAGGP